MRSCVPVQPSEVAPPLLPPVATISWCGPLVRSRLPRHSRSVLHGAEASGNSVYARDAIAWFRAAGMEPPINWLLAAAEVFGDGARAQEYFGHAIRRAVQLHRPKALLRIAERAKRSEPILARLARRAAAGHEVLDRVEDQMASLDVDLTRACVPSPEDFVAPPPTLETISDLPREHIYDAYNHSSVHPQLFSGELRADLRRAFRRQSVDSLIDEGVYLLQHYNHAAWAWRFFEAAEHMRDVEAVLKIPRRDSACARG